jgi:hypothetical protein
MAQSVGVGTVTVCRKIQFQNILEARSTDASFEEPGKLLDFK